jgi:uncharacterized membrane protein
MTARKGEEGKAIGRKEEERSSFRPFRAAVLRGLGVVLPPFLTVVIFAWAGNVIYQNLFEPVLRLTREHIWPGFSIPALIAGFILVIYLLGKFMAAGIGRFFWNLFERGVDRVPLVRNVYGAVKQVSDFILAEREIEYSRVVAIEWPRKGIWSLALVTGESMIDIEAAANEPVLSVLIPTSPMPMTGFTLTVKKSETVDLKISFDEAIQFIVSCGVVVPPSQMRQLAAESSESSVADADTSDVAE